MGGWVRSGIRCQLGRKFCSSPLPLHNCGEHIKLSSCSGRRNERNRITSGADMRFL